MNQEQTGAAPAPTTTPPLPTNVMRQTYRVLTDNEKGQMAMVKGAGMDFYAQLHTMGSSREISLAKTKVEEAVMWAVKHITG